MNIDRVVNNLVHLIEEGGIPYNKISLADRREAQRKVGVKTPQNTGIKPVDNTLPKNNLSSLNKRKTRTKLNDLKNNSNSNVKPNDLSKYHQPDVLDSDRSPDAAQRAHLMLYSDTKARHEDEYKLKSPLSHKSLEQQPRRYYTFQMQQAEDRRKQEHDANADPPTIYSHPSYLRPQDYAQRNKY